MEEGVLVCLCFIETASPGSVDLTDARREFRGHEGDAGKESRDAVERRVGRVSLKSSVRRG